MATDRPIGVVADELRDAILATPKRQRRLLSRTFWEKFGFKARTKDRVEAVKRALAERQIRVVQPLTEVLGSEGRESWIVLVYYPEGRPAAAVPPVVVAPQPPLRPPGQWFEVMQRRDFESEREVETYFVIPLLESLGYIEADVVMGLPVDQYEGTTKHKTEADVVVFNGAGRGRGEGLLVVEVKQPKRALDSDVVGQARSYAFWLEVPFYVVTNGHETVVHAFRGGGGPDVPLLTVQQASLAAQWDALAALLGRQPVVARKGLLAAQWSGPQHR